jgi:hypothetical protein
MYVCVHMPWVWVCCCVWLCPVVCGYVRLCAVLSGCVRLRAVVFDCGVNQT